MNMRIEGFGGGSPNPTRTPVVAPAAARPGKLQPNPVPGGGG